MSTAGKKIFSGKINCHGMYTFNCDFCAVSNKEVSMI